MSSDFLPYGRQTIEDDDVASVAAALRDDLLTTGPRVEAYETAFARATGARYALACNSGTAALHLSAMALGVGPRQAVVVPSMTFLATANAVRMTGADVVFADVDADTGLLTPATLIEAVVRGRKAGLNVVGAIPVHLNGQRCDMPELANFAREQGLWLMEDACHALGVDGAGSTKYSCAACFSTHPVKLIATGEGGVVTTADANIAARVRSLRSHGITREPADFVNQDLAFDGERANPWYYEMQEIGWNYRISDILCALGASQLRKLGRFHDRRKAIAARYDLLLAPLAPTVRPVPHDVSSHGWHLYPVLIDFAALSTTRGQFMQTLREKGVGTQVHYIPVHRQPYYRERYGMVSLPGAEAYYARCLSIPIFPGMTDADVERVAGALGALVTKRSVG